ncbi:excalibur calcium-binding domain-containing protein [Corynebacterium mastitidis]|uniref:excalibur calcium-binding domain-containing protein n=1 Tax=Corynebacterium mastitidis TaxID=161890 RepID=UPI0032B73BF8
MRQSIALHALAAVATGGLLAACGSQFEPTPAAEAASPSTTDAPSADPVTSAPSIQDPADPNSPAPTPTPGRIYDPNPRDTQGVALGETYYSNCGQAEAALALPLHEGQPGYRPALDRDGDGIACESENWSEPGVWPSPTQVPKAFGWEDVERLKNDPTIDYDPSEYPGGHDSEN